MFTPRPKQRDVIAFSGGRMGVVAVPGSGKTRTLSALAARLVAEAPLQDGQEILVVTLVNSAVGNFARQVAAFIAERGLIPGLGYRVRTLHGLANDIVRERPALAGLEDRFAILDERESQDILQDAAAAWVRNHPNAYYEYAADSYQGDRESQNAWGETVTTIAANFIKKAKDLRLTPDALRDLLAAYRDSLPLAELALDIYIAYERGLRYRGAVDFQDLIRLALTVLEADAGFLQRLRRRWPYILEDEAQDSSRLQEHILRLLVGPEGNWVRVGDPNQAIYETFTTASPEFLRSFLREAGVQPRALPNSGRSALSIIQLANRLIDWSLGHPNPELRARVPLELPHIEPTPPGDPQGNPPDSPQAVELVGRKFTADEERAFVARSLKDWLPQHPTWTAAVLIASNESGSKLVARLREAGIPYVENLRTTTPTRAVVGAVTRALDFLRDPKDANKLAYAYRVWQRDAQEDSETQRQVDAIATRLRSIKAVENFLWPRLDDWLDQTAPRSEYPGLHDHLVEFRNLVRRWQAASTLPVDQLVLTVAADLFTRESDIATAYSLALHLRHLADNQPSARLPDFVDELAGIAQNRRKFDGLSDDDDSFDPDQHRGKVAIMTLHKAKGLEWDRVYLMSANNYDFPSAEGYDRFIGERWFVRDRLNLDAEALGQLDALVTGERYSEGISTARARLDYAAERLRLLYVGITRARRELVVTWNTGRSGDLVEALPVAALRGWWESRIGVIE